MMRSFDMAFDNACCLSRRHLDVMDGTRLLTRKGTTGLAPAVKIIIH